MTEHHGETAMRKIIVGFDGSDEARDGLRLGRSLATATGAQLIVASASDVIPTSPRVDLSILEDRYFADVFAKAEDELGSSNFERRVLRELSAPRALVGLAEGEGADLIVVGSAHRGTVGRVLLGTVGERLLYGAPCAVAVAPRGYAGNEQLGSGIIGVAYDGNEESRLALSGAIALVTLLGGELRVITAVPDVAALVVPEISLDDYREDLRRHYRMVQEQAVREIGEAVRATAVLEDGEPAEAITGNAVDLDLLVIGSRGYGPIRRTLLGGVSAKIMRTAPCPVIVVPRGAAADSQAQAGT
jgi:nucleotide-binding universal stress UspA family protein